MKQDNFIENVWNKLASLKLTVSILLTLAFTSIIGTVIPQHGDIAEYTEKYGPRLATLFEKIGFFDVYHSSWYQLLLVLLVINILVCSIHRLKSTFKIVFIEKPIFHISKFKNVKEQIVFTLQSDIASLENRFMSILSKKFGFSELNKTEKGFCIYAEKGRFTRLGVYAVHLSVILMLAGGLIGSIFGFEGYVQIPEGQSKDTVTINGEQEIKLDFAIRCDKFSVSYYDSGEPEEYRSELTLLKDDKPILSRHIIVNDPLRYGGINIFQSSYGTEASDKATFNFFNAETNMSYQIEAGLNQETELPEGQGKFVVKQFHPNFTFKNHELGPSFILELMQKDVEPAMVFLPVQYPQFDRMRKGTFVISVSDYKKTYYTGLQITNDPGVLIVYTGFVLMLIGIYMALALSHQRVCVEVTEQKNKNTIEVFIAGTSNKNKIALQNKIKKLSDTLKHVGAPTLF